MCLALQGRGAILTTGTHASDCLLGISLNLIFWYNLFPVLKKYISSPLVHYHLGNYLFSIILTTQKLIVLDFLFKFPSSFFFFLIHLYNSSFVFVCLSPHLVTFQDVVLSFSHKLDLAANRPRWIFHLLQPIPCSLQGKTLYDGWQRGETKPKWYYILVNSIKKSWFN